MNSDELKRKAAQLRRDVVYMIGPENRGHLGGSCSLADIVTVLYYDVMRIRPQEPQWERRDRFLLSKGHAALIQYAALGDLGYYPREEQKNFKHLGSPLQGHPDMRKLPGIEANTGSLGQGLSLAAGMAAGLRMDNFNECRVYCCLGDGEQGEGQVWEAAMSAAAFKLDNLIAIVDNNELQATGKIEDRFDTHPFGAKWQAFGWKVISINGHDIDDIRRGLDQARVTIGQPSVLIASTIKGKGFDFAENVVSFHNGAMTADQYEKAMKQEGKA